MKKHTNFFFFFFCWLSVQELSGLGYKKGKPLGLVGVTELSEDQKKQIKEQQEVENHECYTAPLCHPEHFISLLENHLHLKLIRT